MELPAIPQRRRAIPLDRMEPLLGHRMHRCRKSDRPRISFGSSLLWLAAFCLVLGCQTGKQRSWLLPPPNPSAYTDTLRLERFDIQDDRVRQAELVLEHQDHVRLTKEEAQQYTGKRMDSERIPILVRTTTRYHDIDGYTIFKGDSLQIFIRHASMGRGVPAQNSPIILLVDTLPSKIWNDCFSIL